MKSQTVLLGNTKIVSKIVQTVNKNKSLVSYNVKDARLVSVNIDARCHMPRITKGAKVDAQMQIRIIVSVISLVLL